jgi:hypothetical protein
VLTQERILVQAQQKAAPQSVQPVTTTLLLFHSIRLLAQKLLKLLPTLSGTQPLPLVQLQRQLVLPRQLLEQRQVQQVLQLVAVEVPVVPGLRPVDQLEVPVVLVKVVRLRPSILLTSATATSVVAAEISGRSGRRSG